MNIEAIRRLVAGNTRLAVRAECRIKEFILAVEDVRPERIGYRASLYNGVYLRGRIENRSKNNSPPCRRAVRVRKFIIGGGHACEAIHRRDCEQGGYT